MAERVKEMKNDDYKEVRQKKKQQQMLGKAFIPDEATNIVIKLFLLRGGGATAPLCPPWIRLCL